MTFLSPVWLLLLLAVAALLVAYVVTGVRNKRLLETTASSKPSPAARATHAATGKPTTKPAPKATAAPTFDRATNTYSFPNKVLFQPDKYTLRPEARAALDAVITAVKAQKRYGTIVVTGYTDDTGTSAYNLTLSENRARVVGNYLTGGLNPDRFPVAILGRGEADPAVRNTDAASREQNRRVEIKVPDPQR